MSWEKRRILTELRWPRSGLRDARKDPRSTALGCSRGNGSWEVVCLPADLGYPAPRSGPATGTRGRISGGRGI